MEAVYRDLFEKKLDEEYSQAVRERYQIKNGVVEWLASMNIKYFLTITFFEETTELWNRKLLNKLMKHLNRRIYKNRYAKGQSYIEGIAIREPTPAFNTDHYHLMLLGSEWMPEFDRMNELIREQYNYFGYNEHNKLCKRNCISTIDFQEYYNNGDNGLEHYLNKKFEFLSNPLQECYDSIGTLGAGDVVFGRTQFNS